MPGHKRGCGIPGDFLSDIEKLDLTEIPGLDDLHNPSGIIKEAQELAAEAFGARKSYFLVNGSTVGIHAAISAVCRQGQRLAAGRDSHSSVIGGMLMAGVKPYYIMPGFSDAFGICTGITPGEVERALSDAPDAVGVIITRPNYFGICSDIREIAKIVHSRNKILIVDEAHGAHLVFNKRLPSCALEAGADICIQSAHKTLPAFTQSSYLHVGSDRVDTARLEYFLDMYQTTSPSYILMAFLDIARAVMQRQGRQLLDRLLDSLESHMIDFKGTPMILGKDDVPGFELDMTRLTVNVSPLGMTGYDAERILRHKHNIQVEMADAANVVCILTVADNPENISRLFSVLEHLERDKDGTAGGETAAIVDLARRQMGNMALNARNGCCELEPAGILDAGTERVSLREAAGRISKGMIAPYPPGIPLVCPGETITHDTVGFLTEVKRAGGHVHGIGSDGTVAVIKLR